MASPRSFASRQALASALALLVAAAGCGQDGTGLRDRVGPPGINIVSGANVTDTAGALLSQPLRVVIRDARGHVVPGAVVRFSSPPIVGFGGIPTVSVAVGSVPPRVNGSSEFLAETTSADGVALVRIQLLMTAGAGAVAIAVPAAGLQDTARYTITPGAPVWVVLPVSDTAIQVGRTFSLKGEIWDRNGNPRPDPVTYTLSGTGVSLTNGQVSATALGRAMITGRANTPGVLADTTWISVVPPGTVAAWLGSKLVTAGVDGTGRVEIPTPFGAFEHGLEWHPDGHSLLALLNDGTPASLYHIQLNGTAEQVTTPRASSAGGSFVPGAIGGITYSPDGQWIYLSGNGCNADGILYRLPVANPSAIERLSPGVATLADCFDTMHAWPSLSPDGSRLAFENQTSYHNGYSVRVMTLATRQIAEIVAGGQWPRWSPAGDLIAYWAGGQIWVVHPDGTGAHSVSPPGRSYDPGVQWSPDGQWLLARFDQATVAMLNVNTGLELPLAWTTHYGGVTLPAWKPGP